MTRARVAGLLAGLALTVGPGIAADVPPRIDVVVDASVDMWSPYLREGIARVEILRQALGHALSRMPADGSQGDVVVWLMGADTPWWADGACNDFRRVTTTKGVDHRAIRSALATVEPRGLRPLDETVVAILGEHLAEGQKRRLVLLIAGVDSCQGDDAALAEAVTEAGDTLQIRIVGLGLNPDLARTLTGAAPTRNVNDPVQLAPTIEWALRGDGAMPPKRVSVDISLSDPLPTGARAALHRPDDDVHEPLRIDDSHLWGKVLPGRYTLRLESQDGELLSQHGGVDVVADVDNLFSLPLAPDPPPSLEVIPQQPEFGSEVWLIPWGDHGTSPVLAALASPGSPADGFIVARPVGDGHAGAVLDVPDAPQLLEARLLSASAGGILTVIARSSVEVVRTVAELEAPESVETGTEFEIDWSGPDTTGDQLMLVPSNPVLVASTVCISARSPSPASLIAPLEPGNYALQYLAGLTRRVVSSRTLELFRVLARLSAPDSAFAGEDFEVTWEGPGARDDFLSITRPDAPNTTYESWTGTLTESPATLTAPTEPGTWELRYVASDGTVLARSPLEVESRPVALEAPDTVLAGTRVSVTWTGPDGPGDLIVIAPVDAPPRRILDWATTSAGNPASLAAPFDPGKFEIRYLRGSDHDVVASRPLTVR